MPKIRYGIDTLPRYAARWRGKRVGLLTHAPAVTGDLRRSADAVRAVLDLRLLWSPEHGLDGTGAPGEAIRDGADPAARVPVASLYGERNAPTPEELAAVDAVFCDFSDIGSRYYAYIHTMRRAMEACARAGVPFVVLDRPNPIGGRRCEGILPDPALAEGPPIPARHGFTLGECARFFNARGGIGCDLTVLPVEGWNRGMEFEDYGSGWINPSPNMPSADAARLYTGTCLLEGTSVTEGRGTTRPYETVGAPFLADPEKIAAAFRACHVPGVTARACRFRPPAGRFRCKTCGGIQLILTDRRNAETFAAGIRLMEILRNEYPAFGYPLPRHFDNLLGSAGFRLGRESAGALIARAEAESAAFRADVREFWLYRD